MRSCQQIVTSLLFFGFMANLELSGSSIQDAESVKLTFSLKITFYLTKTEKELKNFQHSSHTIALSKGIIFAKKTLIFCTKMLTSAILNLCVYLCTKFQVSSIIITSFKQEGNFTPPPTPTTPRNKPLKSPPRLGLIVATTHKSLVKHCWFYYKTPLCNFKYCRVQIEKASYWLPSKQSISNHVSV